MANLFHALLPDRMFGCCHGFIDFNPIALRKAKIVYNFGLSVCNRVKMIPFLFRVFFEMKFDMDPSVANSVNR